MMIQQVRKSFLSLLLFFSIPIYAQQGMGLEWAKSMRGTGTGSGGGYSITTDATGNVYTTGYFKYTVDFDPGVGTFNLTSAGYEDIFIQKLDSNGNLLWAISMEGTDSDYGNSITTDTLGNVYTTGCFRDTVDFDPGAGTFNLTSVGYKDIFIQKLDADGNLLWAVSMGGIATDIGHSIITDVAGNVYTTGGFNWTVDFDPGADTHNLTSTGYYDIFIQKLDPNGNLIWARSMGGTSSDYGYSITTDALGNVYTIGTFRDIVDFDPGAGTFNLTSAGYRDIFIQKLDPNGNLLWARSIGGAGDHEGLSITTDALGNVYTTGCFYGTADFDPGGSTYNLSSVGNTDIFIQKLDPNGNLLWAKSMGGIDGDQGNSISTDALGNVYTTGYFFLTADFDPGAGTFNLTSAGYKDIFIQKLDPNGNLLWARSMGGESGIIGDDEGGSITTDALGNVYTTGYFRGIVDFDPGVGTLYLITAGSYDIFIQKLKPCVDNYSTDTWTACESYTWINGITYTSSNDTATNTLINSGGCDSVVTLNLTIYNSSTGTDPHTACDSYTWIDGNTYTSNNNTATHTLTNAAGCDSVVTLNLTVLTPGNFIASVTPVDYMLSAEPVGAAYQWLACDTISVGNPPVIIATSVIIPGATNQDFTPNEIGHYAVIVTSGTCSDTSDCENVTVVGLQEKKKSELRIYPNPTTGILTIEGAEGIASIYDIYGRLVLTANTNALDISKAAMGIYFVRVLDEQGKVYVAKVMKEQDFLHFSM